MSGETQVFGQSDGITILRGSIQTPDSGLTNVARSSLAQTPLAKQLLSPSAWRVHDSFAALPTVGAADDLGAVAGAFATSVPTIQSGDVKALGATTRYARLMLALPPEYDTGSDVRILVKAGMLTNVADATAVIDFSAYLSAGDSLVSGSDLITTVAQDINSLTFEDIYFNLNAASLSPGDTLDIRMLMTITDAATVTAVIGCAIPYLCLDIRG